MEERKYIEEDEINLREFGQTIGRYKKFLIFFSLIVTSLSVVFLIFQPNIYKSELMLLSQDGSQSGNGGLNALAGLAGIDVGRGGNISPFANFEALLQNRSFHNRIITKYMICDKLNSDHNYVYPLGLDFRKLDKNNTNLDLNLSKEDKNFGCYKTLQSILKITEDKKSGMIILSAESPDRFLAKELVDIYLTELSSYLRENDMIDTDKKISFYEQELQITINPELQTNLTQLLSSLIQKRVLANSSEFYIVKKLVDSEVAFIKDKIAPKRGLIIIVSFITSFILAIFIIFFREFIKGGDKN